MATKNDRGGGATTKPYVPGDKKESKYPNWGNLSEAAMRGLMAPRMTPEARQRYQEENYAPYEEIGASAAMSDFAQNPLWAFLTGRASGTSGGGGGRSSSSRSLDRYARALQTMLASGQYGQGSDELLASQTAANTQLQNMLETLGTQATGTINTSAQNLQNMLQAQQNPYANFQAQVAQATPQLQQLLEAQGAQTDPLAQFVAATNMANQAQAGAFQNIAGTAGNAWQQGQQQMVGDVAAQRDRDLAALQALQGQQKIGLQQQLAGFQQQAAQNKATSRNEILQMLLQAMQGGARVRGRLF